MNLLKRTRCYTIGCMQYANGEGWRDTVRRELGALGVIVFDPYHKPFINEIKEDEQSRADLKVWMENGEFDRVTERMKQVRADDLKMCDVIDYAIVHIDPKVPTWGSAEELTTITRAKRPMFIFVEGGKRKTPLWVMGMVPHKYIYDSLEEVLVALKKIDSGELKIDSCRWKLFKEEYR